MSKREIAALACRVLALYLGSNIVSLVGALVSSILILFQIRASSTTLPAGSITALILQTVLPSVLYLVFALFLWFRADHLAARMMPGQESAVPAPAFSEQDLRSLSISIIGLTILIDGIGNLSPIAAYLMHTRETDFWANKPNSILPQTLQAAVQLGIGLFLLRGIRGTKAFLQAGRPPDTAVMEPAPPVPDAGKESR